MACTQILDKTRHITFPGNNINDYMLLATQVGFMELRPLLCKQNEQRRGEINDYMRIIIDFFFSVLHVDYHIS